MVKRDLFATINKLTQVGISLSTQKDHSRLMEDILDGAKELTYADGGTLYLVTPQHTLRFAIIQTDSLNIHYTYHIGKESPFPEITLFHENGEPNEHMVASYVFHHGTTVNIVDVYEETGFDFSGTHSFDERNNYRSRAMLTIPLKNHEGEVIGIIQLLNPRKTPADHAYFTFEEQTLVESLASQAAVAMTNYRLIEELRSMFEALTRVICEAIDEKSPVTGKHCKRVPIITEMIAAAVNVNTKGPLAGLRFTQDELYELNIAALLHDCGKVTTPVYVVEKGKKLQTIIDRMDLIDVRLAVLRAEAHIAVLEKKLQGVTPQENWKQLEAEEIAAQKKIEEMRELIYRSNQGSEMMSPEDQQQVHSFAKLQWQDWQGKEEPFLTTDEEENLTIVKGTLTERERQIIQNHVVMTIKMLDKIPYPKYLKEVPEIAGKHHERLDGKGYPNGLKADQLSLRARMLAIADIFEALTAPDRPYKQPMKLSEALRIMQKMSEEGHIDKDIWQIFMNEKVYLRYGKQYLTPEQIDVQ